MATRQLRGLRRRGRAPQHVLKPNGRIDERVRAVGPEHFGVVCVDPHKGCSAWMFADFFGQILIEPTEVQHRQGSLNTVLGKLRQVSADRGIKDSLVSIEQTGTYHLPVQRAFQRAGYDVRLIHPFAVKQYRQPADPGNKTDTTDLLANHRATTHGFARSQQELPPVYRHLRLLIRHRRDLVEKAAALRCQIREHLGVTLPGFAELFHEFFDSDTALTVVRHFASVAAIREAGTAGLANRLRQAQTRFQRLTLERIVAWTRDAAPDDPDPLLQQQIWIALDDDRVAKTLQIQGLEGQIAGLLVQTPYLLLLAIPGINVVSAADLAGELGPMGHYPHPNAITGRSGLCPTRAQSHRTDHANGPLRRHANKRLRAALMQVADNLVCYNDHFRQRNLAWKAQGKDPRARRVRLAKSFSRLAYAIVAGGELFRHPSLQPRGYILDKLLTFQREHDMPMTQRQHDLLEAVQQLPSALYADEAQPLAEQLQALHAARRRRAGPALLGDILPLVLEKLGVGGVQSKTSEDLGPG